MKRTIFLCALFATAFVPAAAFASGFVTISEIMYDPPGTDAGREWLEVWNSGTSSVDMSAWRLYEADTNHKIAPVDPSGTIDQTGRAIIPSGGYAVIADVPSKFKADHPEYSGILFDSAFSLANAGETISLRDDMGADEDVVSYLGAWGGSGDGYSVQKAQSGAWVAAEPTPGAPTVASASSAPLSTAAADPTSTPSSSVDLAPSRSTDDISAHSSQEPANFSDVISGLAISAGRPRTGLAGALIEFDMRVARSPDSPGSANVRTTWSMGDGTEAYGEKVFHAYAFSGIYSVVANGDFGDEHAVGRTTVSIRAPSLRISIGTDLVSGEYAEISNLDSYEANVGGFSIVGSTATSDALGEKRFDLPKDTIIGAGLSIKIPAATIGMALDSVERISLVDPSKRAIASDESPAASPPGSPTVSLPPGFTIDGFIRALKK